MSKKKLNKSKYVPFVTAKEIVRAAGVGSRSQFWRWHEAEQPKYIPKAPHKVYPEWKGWNDFLGNDNSFEKELSRKRKITRPFWESVRWVQAQGYKTKNEYRQQYEEGNVPADIPKMPETFYEEWQGWGAWLGKDLRSKIVSKTEKLTVFAICTINHQAGNVVEIVSCDDGIAALQQMISARPDLTPIKVYHIDSDDDQQLVVDILNKFGSAQGGNTYLIPNMSNLVYELQDVVRPYVPK